MGDFIGTSSSTDNIIAALGQSNRVCDVCLLVSANSQWEEVMAAMQVPFPELTRLHLKLSSHNETLPAIPESFLGGSAPHLQYLSLSGILFPGLPKLLLSTVHLVFLDLLIPHSGYISPEAMVALLSMLASLDTLSLEFKSPQSRPDQESRCPPPLKRSILPTLNYFDFNGVTGYLEELVTHIDTPQLRLFSTIFINQIDFDCPRLPQFINRTPTLRSRAHKARVEFDDSRISVSLEARPRTHHIKIKWTEPDRQLLSVARFCTNSSLHPLSTVEDLYIVHRYRKRFWMIDAIESTLCLQLFLPFTAMKNLYLFKEFAPGIAAALQELVGDRISEVLPSLQNIFVEELEASGPVHEYFGQFVAARQFSNHPVSIFDWERGSDMRWM